MSQRNPPVTIKHIADVLKMNHATVSRALNDHPKISTETKERVREAARALGYIANSGARLMRSGDSHLVGLIVPDVQNEFFNAAARAMAACSAQFDFQMMLGLSEDDPQREEQQVRAFRESRVAGVLIAPCSAPTAETAKMLQQIPTVQFLRFQPDVGPVGIRADDHAGICAATLHLVELGHQRIGFIGTPRELSTGNERMTGYYAALAMHGISVDPRLSFFGPARPEAGYAAVRKLLRGPGKPTALVVASSRQLLGSMRALHEDGIVLPDDLSLVGYGDTDWFQACSPAITAVSLPVDEMSQHATNLLFNIMRDESAVAASPHTTSFATKLIVRGSTCALSS